jgi:Xaa-Pro dipeptidase
MDLKIYEETISKVQSYLEEKGLGLQFVCSLDNLVYLTGVRPLALERLTLLSIPQERKPHLIVPKLSEQEFSHLSGLADLLIWEDGQDPLILVREELGRLPSGLPLAMDRGVPGYLILDLAKKLPLDLILFDEDSVKRLRQIKTQEEIKLLQESGAVADEVLKSVLEFVRPGMSELEVASFMITEIMKRGAVADPSIPIVASGPNSAVPHHQTGPRRFQLGDPLLIDFGCVLKGYHSDVTRTFFLGLPSEEFRKVYEIVKQAQAKALSAIRPGILLGSLDEIARNHISESGYDQYFIHRLGHGLGMEIHEEPYVYSGNPTLAEAGMCFSVEPGIYLPGRFGVRIEDCVVVQEREPLLLTHFPKELTSIEK